MPDSKLFNNNSKIFITLIITITGIWFLLFSFSRINHWDNHTIIALGSLGFIFLLLGIDLKLSPKPILGLIGSTITTICVFIYYFISHSGTDILTIIGTFGLVGIIAETLYSGSKMSNFSNRNEKIIQNIDINHHPSAGNTINEFKEIDTQFESLKGVIQGFKIKNLEKIDQINEVNHDYLLTIIKTRDYLDKIISKGDVPQAIKNLDLEINQFFEDRNIIEIPVNIGDIFDPLKMKATIDPINPGLKIKSVIKKGYMVKTNQNEQIIRKPLVEIDEN